MEIKHLPIFTNCFIFIILLQDLKNVKIVLQTFILKF